MRHRILAAPRVAAGAVLVAVLLPAVIEAVYVSPTAVFMDERAPSAQVTIGNAGDAPEEATVEIKFGFPDADSAGTPFVRMVDDPDSTYPSAADWIRAFPQRVLLQPRSQQIVRLLARPPAGLPAGEYWARLIVTAKGGQVPVTSVGDSTGITVGLTLEVRTILPVLYRKGPVTTGVAVSGLRASIEKDSLVVRAHMVRIGSAAFVGTMNGALIDVSGKAVARFSFPQAVYFEMEPRFTTSIAGLPRGQYRLRFEATTERQDLPSEVILPMAPVRDSVQVALP